LKARSKVGPLLGETSQQQQWGSSGDRAGNDLWICDIVEGKG
jgi:hypothetical protein